MQKTLDKLLFIKHYLGMEMILSLSEVLIWLKWLLYWLCMRIGCLACVQACGEMSVSFKNNVQRWPKLCCLDLNTVS